MVNNDLRRIQKSILDIENTNIEERMKNDLANYTMTQEEKEWNEFALKQLESLEEWT